MRWLSHSSSGDFPPGVSLMGRAERGIHGFPSWRTPDFLRFLLLRNADGKLQVVPVQKGRAGVHNGGLVAPRNQPADKSVRNDEGQLFSVLFQMTFPINFPNAFQYIRSFGVVNVFQCVLPQILHRETLDQKDLKTRSGKVFNSLWKTCVTIKKNSVENFLWPESAFDS